MAYGSPFTPRSGDAPLCPGGRAAELALVRDFAARVAHVQVSGSNGLLFTGSKGMGKTALLARTDSMLSQLGWRVASIDRTESGDVGAALRDSLDSAGMRGAAARLHERVQSLRGLVRGASVSVGLDGPSASLDLGRPGRSRPVDIAAQVAEAGATARRTAEPAMIVVDDLHEWSPSELRNLSEFWTAVLGPVTRSA